MALPVPFQGTHAGKVRRGRPRNGDSIPVRCMNCAAEIEHCEGEHGIWMHATTRREHCADGQRLAFPELVSDIDRRSRAQSTTLSRNG